jgi:hypothetical protein
MQITRAKATALLNKGEMQLYDDSRQNALRGFTASQLETRVTRARSARDRSRDLLRRQKLSSRASTGSKRGTSGAANQRSKDKAEVMADILKRFETRLKEAKKIEKEAAKSARPVAKKATKKAVRKVAKKATKKAVKKAAKKTVSKKAAKKTTKKATKKTAKKTATAKKKVTPGQALRSTRKVLEAKQEEARQPKPWQDATAHGGQVGSDGFQSAAAAHRAEELQAAASRMPAIHGSAGTRGRINQGKRDSKGEG